MRSPPAAPLLLATLVAALGCAYYNGMYNANRLAKQAERAEREGRRFEATGLWAQAAVRAESVLARHPTSKWADDARLLRGKALAKQGDCDGALPHLRQVTATSPDSQVVEQASLYLGECYLAVGQFLAADAAFRRALATPDTARKRELQHHRARALTMAGRYQEAMALYRDAPDPSTDGVRLLAVAGGGTVSHALALADTLLERGDSLVSWDSVTVVLRRRDPGAASAVTDRILEKSSLTPETRARWLLRDGQGLLAVDTSRGIARLRQAFNTPEHRTDAGSQARLTVARLDLARARAISDLDAVTGAFDEARQLGGSGGFLAGRYLQAIERVRQVADSVDETTGLGDLDVFLAAEAARDSLEAPALAYGLFERVAGTWPLSPFAPKALLAMAALRPREAATTFERLQAEYGDSPYVTWFAGTDSPAYRALEDSLRSFALSRLTGRQPPGATPQPSRPRPRPVPGRRPPERDRRVDGVEEQP